MNTAVYIVICHINTYGGTTTFVDIFNTLPEAQAYKARKILRHKYAICEIYKSYKEE